MRLNPNDYDKAGDIIPDATREEPTAEQVEAASEKIKALKKTIEEADNENR